MNGSNIKENKCKSNEKIKQIFVFQIINLDEVIRDKIILMHLHDEEQKVNHHRPKLKTKIKNQKERTEQDKPNFAG